MTTDADRLATSKLPYHPPVVEVYGTMADLTAAGGQSPGQDGTPNTYGVGAS